MGRGGRFWKEQFFGNSAIVFGDKEGRSFLESQFFGNGDLDEERRSFLGDVGMAITYRIFLLS
jgi:hypothetical protein